EDTLPSAGQVALLPVQTSCTSQTPALPRHTVPEVAKTSGPQSLLVPLQTSATSQTPADGRQTAVLFASAGQLALVPLHTSAGSHTPADGRQMVPALPGANRHVLVARSHVSTVHTLPSLQSASTQHSTRWTAFGKLMLK